ncbi:MAG: hypothetical protein KDD55_10495, partial [Bdellovibrionales bacterium]|nr:hypothetical protein [Bdellovibrionales bacterium]
MRFFLTRFTILLLLFSRPLLAAPSPDVSLLNVSTNVLKLKVKIPGKYAGKIGKIILQKLVTKNQYQKFGKKRLRPSSKKNTIHMKLTESLNYGVHYFRARVVAKGVGKSKWSDDLKVVKALI